MLASFLLACNGLLGRGVVEAVGVGAARRGGAYISYRGRELLGTLVLEC